MKASGRRIPALHLVTNDRVLAAPEFPAMAMRALEAGGNRVAFHLRGPGTGGRWLWELGRELAASAAKQGALLLVNDRVDVAMIIGADGVHLGGRSLPPSVASRILGEGDPPAPVLGRSVHAKSELEALPEPDLAVLDYLMVGTIFSTPSHPGRAGAGPAVIREVSEVGGAPPLIGIGGITAERVVSVVEAGATGVAVVREVWEAERPELAVERLLDALG